MNYPVLSILVISHNQCDLLRRCMDSILAQKIRVSFEVVISDDRSTDGTWELIEQYSKDYPSAEQTGEYWTPQILGYKCNSNECNPLNVSERCGWNKLNAYQHARGKYFVNIDADDFLKSDDIYQLQLDMLESHPECAMCMQDVWQVNDGDSLDKAFRWPSFGKLRHGEVLSDKEIITTYRAVNPCYMIRRHPEVDCASLYGKHFDDTIITLHHLQFGKCVYIDRADYVWIRYNTSITGTLKGDDQLVEFALLPLHHIHFLPSFLDIFMEDGLSQFIHMFKVLDAKNYQSVLTDRTLLSIQYSRGRIYRMLENITRLNKIRLKIMRLVLLLFKKSNCKQYKLLYKYMVG